MIENVIENLDKLYNDIKQEQEITQSSIQNNAKEILSEINISQYKPKHHKKIFFQVLIWQAICLNCK